MLRQGRTSSLEADVWYFPLGNSVDTKTLSLSGPFSKRGRTLPATFRFQRTELAGREAWKTTIPEPSLWTPESPAYYQLSNSDELIGLRDLRIRGDSFYTADRRWLIRAAQLSTDSHSTSDLVRIDSFLTKEAAITATQYGCPRIIHSESPTPELITTASESAAVLMLILPFDCHEDLGKLVHSHVLIGTHLEAGQPIPVWAQFVSVSENLLNTAWKPERKIPVVATRRGELENHTPGELRQMCDQFQADLDHGADYAGLWLLPKTSG